MKKLLLFAVAVAITNVSFAQFSEFQNSGASMFTLASDNNTLQIGGRISFYYEDRFLKSGVSNLSHNGFDVKDADLDFLGKTASKFTYEFHISVVDLAVAAATKNTNNPANPGIKAGYLQYTGFPFLHIKFGYDKLPYSQGSLNEVWGTPMFSHANLYGGDLFSRRDIGLTLQSTLWKDRINIYGGAYSGMGENFFEYGNDPSGRFEYVGRAEFSYPGKMKYAPLDEENSPTPQFRIAVNARYTDKTQPAGSSIYTDEPDAPGAYGIRIIDGKRLVYGGDCIIKFKGLSALFETDIVKLQPSSNTDPLYYSTAGTFNGNYIMAGGFVTGLNYDSEPIHSVFSIQYEDFNANDLAVNASSAHNSGEQSWIYLGYAYKVSGFNSVFKAEYYIPGKEALNLNPLKYTGQLRVGYQIVF